MKRYNSPKCTDDAAASMSGKECHIADIDEDVFTMHV